MTVEYSEDFLIQRTVADYLHDNLGWESVYAFNDEVLGESGTLGRKSETEVVLVRYLRAALEKLNPGLPTEAYESAIKTLTEFSAAKAPLLINKDKYEVCKSGVPVTVKKKDGGVETRKLRVFDYTEPGNNHFLAVRELWIQGALYRRRPDVLCYVNGLPLLFIELKNIHKDIRRAYEGNLSDYKDTIPDIFHHNAIIVLSNGTDAKLGSFSAKYEHFFEWKRLAEEDAGIVDMETLLKGICTKRNLLDLFENFIVFDDSTGKLVKILAKNHQYLGVNRAIQAVVERKERQGKLGVFWHTQGSGKSYSMVFFSQKVHRKLRGNFTFLIMTDREDLETQIYKTFAGCGIVDNDKVKCRASSGDDLENLMKKDQPFVFSMIHKFNKNISPEQSYTSRDEVIVISDEAHRTQYGRLAINMRNALPNASYIGFTGTPLFKDDELTKRIFGDYVSTYDFQRAVDDKATVPLYYDNRGDKLHITMTDINDQVAEKLEEYDLNQDQRASLEHELGRDYHVYTAGKRLLALADDFVSHYTGRWETGKAMLVCLDKITTVRMYNLIQARWRERIKEIEGQVSKAKDEQEETFLRRQLQWLKETEIAVVISEEQGEVKLFKEWGLDIIPHREKIKNGYETPDNKRIDIDLAFKEPEHKFRVAIVCAMWMTGFDVPSLSTLYLDKPLKAHTLMQAIARANRVYEEKENGLIVDYCGILKNLREALATFAAGSDGTGKPESPIRPEDELIAQLAHAIEETKSFLYERGFDLKSVTESSGFDRVAAIAKAKEIINQSEETRKRYEILAREVFKKLKACVSIRQVHKYREDYGAIDIIYKKLQDDRQKANITSLVRELQAIVDTAIQPTSIVKEDDKLYDISKIDFDKLRKEFAKVPRKNTMTYELKTIIEKRLQTMLARNPLRADLYSRYQEIIAHYNIEKDRITIEETFATLLRFVEQLDREDKRAIREGLDEEALALFDLLEKPNLSTRERNIIKKVSKELLEELKKTHLQVSDWREKEATRAAVRAHIHDFLWSENTGLPSVSYSSEDVEIKTEIIYRHIFTQYINSWTNVYQSQQIYFG
ncbi:type I restriction endonuclease subunit R [Zoogloea sp.]|uniref:type I restriction endonuclease subunit R n=1 Tax=Zoogloea sp. TaxID=49181 RepID=UPI00141588E9|nr:MAG: type I restriction endonuclease subunit R [Zoogloea sp.]